MSNPTPLDYQSPGPERRRRPVLIPLLVILFVAGLPLVLLFAAFVLMGGFSGGK